MRALLVHALVLGVVAAAGCTDRGVGRKCINPAADAGVTGTQISSPALECISRLCLIQKPSGGNTVPHTTCTAECNTDADCAGAVIDQKDPSLCKTEFVCVVATVAGAFKCKKLCMCREDVECGVHVDQDGGAFTPSACPMPSPVPSCS